MWPPTLTACECEQSGWCPRHQCTKTAHWHLLCRRQEAYFQMWEQGQGPCLEGIGQPPPTEVADAEIASHDGPGILRRAWNFGQAAVRHATDGGVKVDDAVYEQRLGICRACQLCDQSRMVCTHPNCGCFLTVKAHWRSENCPLGMWTNSESDNAIDSRRE